MKRFVFSSLAAIALFASSAVELFAQPTPPAAPIDGGVGILAAAGVAYGAKKVYDLRKKRRDEDA